MTGTARFPKVCGFADGAITFRRPGTCIVSFTQPLRLGDRITVGGETGFVEDMALIYTTLVTDDARRIFVPNTQLTTSMIVNRTIKDPRRAVTARFPVSIETPIPEAREAFGQIVHFCLHG